MLSRDRSVGLPVIVHLSPELDVTIPEELLSIPFSWQKGKQMRVSRPGFHFLVCPDGSCEMEIRHKRIVIQAQTRRLERIPVVMSTNVDISLVYNVYGLTITLAFLEYLRHSKRAPVESWLTAYLAGSLISITGKIEHQLFLTPIESLISALSEKLYKREASVCTSPMSPVTVPSLLSMYGPKSGVVAWSTATVLMSDGSVLLWHGSRERGPQQLLFELRDDVCCIDLLEGEDLKIGGTEIRQLTCSLHRYADYFRVRGAHLPTAMGVVLDDLSGRISQLDTTEAIAWLIQLRCDLGEVSSLVLRSREELDHVLRMAIELVTALAPWTAI